MTIGSNFTLPCGVTLKNRLCKAAMTEGIADSNNFTTQKHSSKIHTESINPKLTTY